MLRQRESRELRLLSIGIEVTPPAALTWAHDVFGNAMATAAFAAPTDRLVIASGGELELGRRAVAGVRHRRGCGHLAVAYTAADQVGFEQRRPLSK